MGSANLSAARTGYGSSCYRLTARGRACVDLVETSQETLGSLSRYLHDILMMCGSGMWFEQLRQFMPPRSLEESLQALLALELIEQLPVQDAPRYTPPPLGRVRPVSAFGRMAYA